MAALHLLSSPDAAASCLAAAAADDAVLLLADGVFACTVVAASGARFAVLRDDAASRGIAISADVPMLSQADFVDWVVAYETSVTWR